MALPILIWMYFGMPESVKYLVLKSNDPQKSIALLMKVEPTLEFSDTDVLYINEPPIKQGTFLALFSNGRAVITLLLWIAFLAGQFLIYIMSLWLPTILQSAGWEADLSRNAVGHYYLGASIGGVIIGYLADRFSAAKVLIIAFPVASVLYYVLGQVVTNQDLWFLIAPFAGAIAVGATLGLAPLAANLYPTAIRGSGIGAALGIGRIGSIITPMVGAAMLAANISATGFYNIAMIAPIVCSICLLILVYYKTKQETVV